VARSAPSFRRALLWGALIGGFVGAVYGLFWAGIAYGVRETEWSDSRVALAFAGLATGGGFAGALLGVIASSLLCRFLIRSILSLRLALRWGVLIGGAVGAGMGFLLFVAIVIDDFSNSGGIAGFAYVVGVPGLVGALLGPVATWLIWLADRHHSGGPRAGSGEFASR
jgi:hypothetical protein